MNDAPKVAALPELIGSWNQPAQRISHGVRMLVPVLAPGNVWFAYTRDRKGEHPKAHFNKFQGRLQADGCAGFEQIYDVATFRKRLAGEGSSMICKKPTGLRLRKKLLNASGHSMRWKVTSMDERHPPNWVQSRHGHSKPHG